MEHDVVFQELKVGFPRAEGVDGSEIWRSPVEVGSFIPLFTRFQWFHAWLGGCLGFLNHQR